MSCHDFQHNLALLVGEELEVNEAIAVRRHAAQCPACREALQQLNDSRTVMRVVSEMPAEIDGESLWPRLRAQIMPATIQRSRRSHYPSWVPTATLAAACVAFLVFVGSTPMLDGNAEPRSFVDESFQRQLDRTNDPVVYPYASGTLRGGNRVLPWETQNVGVGIPQQLQFQGWENHPAVDQL